MTDKSQQEGISEYEAEWELESDDPNDQDAPADADQQSFDEPTDSEEAAAGADKATSSAPTKSPEEGGSAEDIWANATEAQRLAFRRAENERVAAANREKLHADKLAERGRELKALRDEKLALEQASIKPTEFESEHEVYARNVEEMIERKLSARVPQVEQAAEKSVAETEQDVFDIITNAHPDAGDVYNSDGLQAMLADDPVFKHAGKAYLFSEALHSTDPNMTVLALSHYKTTATTPSADPLSGMLSPNSSSSKSDMRPASSLSSQEQYDRAWAEDDS